MSFIDRLKQLLGFGEKQQPTNVTTFGAASYDATTNTASLLRNEAGVADVMGGVALSWFESLRHSPEWAGVIETHYGPTTGRNEEEGKRLFVRHYLAYMEDRGRRPGVDAATEYVAKAISGASAPTGIEDVPPEAVALFASVYDAPPSQETLRLRSEFEARHSQE